MSKARNYCFTFNNYTVEEHTDIMVIECKYLVIGKEIGESGTPHLQGFIAFNNQRSFNGMKKLIPRAHIEVAKTIDEAIEYCKKDGEFFEKGEPPMSQKRKGEQGKEYWEDILKKAKSGNLEFLRVLRSEYICIKPRVLRSDIYASNLGYSEVNIM